MIDINWSLLISFASLFISFSGIIYRRIKSGENYSISVIDHAFRCNCFQMLISIVNQSDFPLVISSISCCGNDCELESKRIRDDLAATGGIRLSHDFPLCIPAHGCLYSYLEFVDFQGTVPGCGTHLMLQIHSTRKLEQKTVLLGCHSHYLHTRK